MTDFNPIRFLQHAWDDTHSIWGKACVALFYLFIWSQAIWSLETVIAPKAGWDCYYQGISEYATETIALFIRAMNVVQLGFWIYAHREGIKVWNVTIVFAVNASLFWFYMSSNIMDLDGAPACDQNGTMKTITWVMFWWTLLTLVCSVLEDGSKPRGTTSETNPIIH